MPTLEWIGKKAVVNWHRKVPFRLLRCDPELSVGEAGSGNLLVQGDNLEALKALLPCYAGKVKCIYIDPPYNTGNEGWVYNDAVNSPEMREWLGEAVGRDDLSRHDKWLCMIHPRLALLREFLTEQGLIFISIDDNEAFDLRLLMDEVFGQENWVQTIIWKNKYGPGAMTKGFGNVHEYILCYSKNPIDTIEAPLGEEKMKEYKGRDDKYETRGGFVTQPLATRSKDDRPNLVYPVQHGGEEIWPDKQWIWERSRLEAAIARDEVVFRKSKGRWSVRFKQYLRDERGRIRMAKPISIMNGPFNQEGTWEIEGVFGDKRFPNPKPVALIKYLLAMVVNGDDSLDGVYLDSFAGSGTTAEAVMQLNEEDGGQRRFVLIEMDPTVCSRVTHERLKRATEGFRNHRSGDDVVGIGDGFRYCRLGAALFTADGKITDEVRFADLARHVFFIETGEPLPKNARLNSPFLGAVRGVGVYLLYNGILKDKSPGGGKS